MPKLGGFHMHIKCIYVLTIDGPIVRLLYRRWLPKPDLGQKLLDPKLLVPNTLHTMANNPFFKRGNYYGLI